MQARTQRVGALVVAALFVATSCGGPAVSTETADGANIIDAGGFRVELPDELVVVDDEVEAEPTAEVSPVATSDTAAAAATVATDTDTATDTEPEATPTADPEEIPLAENTDAIGSLFDAFESFSGCLGRLGTEFIGQPDPEIPETMDSQYLADLQVCAAESNILQAVESLDAASANRTPEETESFNEGLLIFVDCLRGRGWTVANPEPDANGALQIGFGGAGFAAPAGESVLGNPNLRECAADAQRAVAAQLEADS